MWGAQEERERARREAEEKAKLLSEKEREMQGARERAQLVAQAKSQLAAKLQAMQNKVLHGGGKDELAKKAKEKEAEVRGGERGTGRSVPERAGTAMPSGVLGAG